MIRALEASTWAGARTGLRLSVKLPDAARYGPIRIRQLSAETEREADQAKFLGAFTQAPEDATDAHENVLARLLRMRPFRVTTTSLVR